MNNLNNYLTTLIRAPRNGIIFSPHPRAKKSTIAAAKIIRDIAVSIGAPEDIIGWIDEPTVELSAALMRHPKISLILASTSSF